MAGAEQHDEQPTRGPTRTGPTQHHQHQTIRQTYQQQRFKTQDDICSQYVGKKVYNTSAPWA